jgi:ketosteroid isomerase-like protein
MSQENVEIVRQMWSDYGERGVDGVLDYFAEDCVCEDFTDMPDRETYEGKQGIRERDMHFAETWGDLAIEPVEFIDAGEGVVVTLISIRGHGTGSGVPIDARSAFIDEFSGGKIVRNRAFSSTSEALEAAGLSE